MPLILPLLFKGREPRGLVYLEAKLVLVRWLANAFISLFLFFLRSLSDLPSLSLFFCPFVLLCLLVLPFAFCVYRSLPMFCVSTLCLSPILVFVCPLFIPCLSPESFLFSFPLFSFFVRASVMACIVGARRMLP
ncbi:hypothetical protein NC653_038056 [Populus alba x Populus x berolinensis]|uniref:Transmembrane protein n=1 Tax=Populus alba x Populus x berolinensis TaxID=444605 RepID=A0AAD6PUD0_9ROSI|nr:hypothetical protein NC653_038056 [Populus alba x Populus x berolinensis]